MVSLISDHVNHANCQIEREMHMNSTEQYVHPTFFGELISISAHNHGNAYNSRGRHMFVLISYNMLSQYSCW